MKHLSNIGIVILESLTKSRSGLELHSTTLKYNLYGKPFISKYYDVKDKTELIASIDTILSEAAADNILFFLHFEMHGFEGGIQLKNGEFVYWAEILPSLSQLNILYKNLLGISMAVCHGASLLKAINPLERAPFRYLVTSHRELNEFELTIGFENFFIHFVNTFRVTESVEKYNETVTDEVNKLYIISSDYCLKTLLKIENDEKNKILEMMKTEFASVVGRSALTDQVINDLREETERIFSKIKINPDFFMMADLQTSANTG